MNLTDRDYACLYKALSDETRIGIVRLLAQGECSVGEIVHHFGEETSYARISHHLAILKSERLVTDRRQGKQILYSLAGVMELLAANRSFCWMRGANEVAAPLRQVWEEPEEEEAITVFAASSLTKALREIGRAFQKETELKVRLHFGSSGMLARELEQGARADLFLSASPEQIRRLKEQQVIDTATLFAKGRLTMWRREGHRALINEVEDLLDPKVRWVVLPNPATAPSGELAVEILKAHGVWDRLQDKLLLANDAAQALDFADTENGGVALTALSVASLEGQNTLIPESQQHPLEHSLALTKSAVPSTEALAGFLVGKKGRSILKQYGFLVS